jgi:hypothetical protein
MNCFNGLLPGAKTVETVPVCASPVGTPLKRGVNEKTRSGLRSVLDCASPLALSYGFKTNPGRASVGRLLRQL